MECHYLAKLKSSLASLVALLALVSGSSEAATISGRVTAAEAQSEPLISVNVWLVGTEMGSETDEAGNFAITDVSAGRYQLQYSLIGRVSTLRWVTIEPRDSAVTISLTQTMVESFIIAPGVSVVADRPVAEGRIDGASTVIGFKEVSEQHALGSEELLRRVPGVTVVGDDGVSNRLNVGIRGLYPRRSARILILEDGVPVQPAPYLAPAAYYNPPSERIEMIEVVKGSAALSFGPQTLGGVINYITKQPPGQRRTSLHLSRGSNGFLSTYLKFGATEGAVGYDLQGLYKSFDGFRDNTSFKLYSGVGKLVWRNGAKSALGLKLNLHAEDAQATYSALTAYEFANAPRTNRLKDDYLDTDRLAFDVTHRYLLSNNTTIHTQAFYTNFTRNWWRENSTLVSATTLFPEAGADELIRVGTGTNKARLREFVTLGMRTDISHNYQMFHLPQRISAGLRLEVDKFWNREQVGLAADARGGKIVKDEFYRALALAGYVRNSLRLNEQVSVTPGFRVETFTQRKETRQDSSGVVERVETTTTELLPGVIAMFERDELTVFAGVHRGFSPPTDVTAFLSPDEIAVQYDGDGTLDSELSWNYEVGFRWRPVNWLRMEPTYFLMDIENMVAAGRKATFSSLGSVRYQGLEVGLAANLQDALHTAFSFTMQAQWTSLRSTIRSGVLDEQGTIGPVDVTGNQAPYAPKNTLRVDASLGLLRDKLRLSAGYTLVSSQFADFNNTVGETFAGDNGLLPAYHTIDLGAGYRLNGSGLELTLAVKNLENNVYRASRLHRISSGIFPAGFRQVNIGLALPLTGSIRTH